MYFAITIPSDSGPHLRRLTAYFSQYEELLHSWGFAEDLDTLEHALAEGIRLIIGKVRLALSLRG